VRIFHFGLREIMGMTIRILILLWLLVAPAALHAAEEIKVPFNFRWGDSAKLVEDTIVRTQAKVVERRKSGARDVLVVEGHPDPRLKRSLFYFANDALDEIELQYADASWDTSRLNGVFEQTRRNLDNKYGISRNVVRQRGDEADVFQTVIGYQWTQAYTSLRLFLYSAEQGAQSYRVLSYHYRGF